MRAQLASPLFAYRMNCACAHYFRGTRTVGILWTHHRRGMCVCATYRDVPPCL